MKIQIKNLCKKFKDKIVFNNFNLTLEDNINVIVGKSGGGKSTLLNVLANLTPYESGEIIGVNEHEISYIFQEDRLIPWLTIKENMEIFMYDYYSKEEALIKLKEILNMLNINEALDKYPVALSGGMCQRVNIARALLKPSNIILMDEPFKSLDYKIKYSIMKKIKEFVKRENKTIIFVTHDIDEGIFMEGTIIVLGGEPFEIKGIYKNDLTKEKNNILQLL